VLAAALGAAILAGGAKTRDATPAAAASSV
jgi:hypothetical protein